MARLGGPSTAAVPLFEALERRVLLDGAPPAPLEVDLQPGSDTGIHDDDDLTNVPTGTIDVLAAQAGDTVRIYRDGTLLGQAAPVSGTEYQYTFGPGDLAEGENAITARSFDGAEESADSPALVIDLDTAGPRLVSATPAEPVNLRTDVLSAVAVQFSEAIDYDPAGGTFSLDDITLVGPAGEIAATAITPLGGDEYEVSFPAQTLRGQYTVSVGPDVADLAGTLMDQDDDGTAGEAGSDAFLLRVDAYDADTVFSGGAAIADGDTTYDGQDICVLGATVSVAGDHPFASVQLIDGARLNQSEATLTAGAVVLGGGSTLDLAGGSTLAVTGGLDVTGGSTVLARGKNTTAQVEGEWVGEGVTIQAVDAYVELGSQITADGQGYAAVQWSAGRGPGGGAYGDWNGGGGGGHGGVGGYGSASVAGGGVYGSVTEPTALGSSGGCYRDTWSGAGGGAIRLQVSGGLVLDGTISADGANGTVHSGGGAGGSLWVTAGTLSGTGRFTVRGGSRQAGHVGGGGAGGRIAVYYGTDDGFAGFTTSTAAGADGYGLGAVGTVGFFDTSITNYHLSVYESLLFPDERTLHYGAITVDDGGTLTLGGVTTVTIDGALTVRGNSSVICRTRNAAGEVAGGVTIEAADVTVELGSEITADGQGYPGVQWSAGLGPGGGAYGDWSGGGGGGHGGVGGKGSGTIAGGGVYGSVTEPTQPGSSGGCYRECWSGAGGGVIRLIVTDTLTLDGRISADGTNGTIHSGGGSGGSIWVTTNVLTGAGAFSAAGGSRQAGHVGGGGAGGRIAVYYADGAGFSGFSASTAAGGDGVTPGGVGTVGFFDTSVTNYHFYVYEYLLFPQDDSPHYGAVTVADGATLTLSGGVALTVDGELRIQEDSTVVALGKNASTPVDGRWAGEGVAIHAGSALIEAGSALTANGQGYVGTTWEHGRGPGAGWYGDWNGGGGGGYGGSGGSGSGGGGGWTYGSADAPTDLGSSGGAYRGATTGAGGGAIRLIVDGTLTLDGSISANGSGASSHSGGGSGGSVWITAHAATGGGTVSAIGGDRVAGHLGGGGGGGRIAIEYSESFGLEAGSLSAAGGEGYNGGAAGTVVVRDLSPEGPYVADLSPPSHTNAPSVQAISLTLSEPVVGAGARDAATYTLLALGPDRAVGGGDDTEIAVTPTYADGTTEIVLALPAALGEGLYQLTAQAGETTGLRDVGGAPLDQDQDGYADDLVATIEVDLTAPIVQEVSVATCLTFDGSDDRVELPYSILHGGTDLTYEFWFRSGREGAVLSAARYGQPNEQLIYLRDGEILDYYDAGSRMPWTGLTLLDQRWHHVAIVRDATNGRIALYFDGVAQGEHTRGLSAVSLSPRGLWLGQEQDIVAGGFATGESLQGQLAELRIWSVARSEAEVQADRFAQLDGTEAGLIGYWPMDDGTGTVVADRSGNGHYGELGRQTAWRPAWTACDAPYERDTVRVRYSDAGGMDDASVTDPANYALLASGGDGTFNDGNESPVAPAAEVRYDPATQTATLEFSEPLPDDYYQLTVLGTATVTDAAGNALLDGADHVTGPLPFEADLATVGVDLQPGSDSGVSNADDITNDTTPTVDVTVSKRGLIEVDFDGDGTYGSPADASLAVEAPGTYAITASSALADAVYTVSARLTPWVGTEVLDSIAVTIDTAGPTVPAVDQGACLSFGPEDHVITEARNWGFAGSATVSAWIRTTNGNAGAVFSLAHSGYKDEILLYVWDGLARIYHHKSGGNWWTLTSETTVSTGEWVHVAGVLDGPGLENLHVFVNGVEERGSAWLDGSPSEIVDDTPRRAIIGWRQNFSGSEDFNGQIAEVRLWDHARIEAEIAADFRTQLTGAEAGLAGYWRLDDGAGTTAADSSATGADATFGDGDPARYPQWAACDAPTERSTIRVTYDDFTAVDPATATDVANYTLEASGGDGTFGDGNEVDLSATIAHVVFDEARQIATLHLSQPLADEYYRVIVNGTASVLDLPHNPLRDGQDHVSEAMAVVTEAPAVSVDLQAGSDSGAAADDDRTHDTTPTFDVTVNQRGRIDVDFDGDGESDAFQDVPAAGAYPFTPAGALDDGDHAVAATFTPWVGDTATATLAVTIDTTGPALVDMPQAVLPPVFSRELAFNEPVDLSTFTTADLVMTAPGGPVDPAGLTLAAIGGGHVFRAQIDGRSRLVIQGGTVQWRHLASDRPGRHYATYPTTVDGETWWPDWPGGEYSSTYAGLAPAMPAEEFLASVNVLEGRGSVSIVQQPLAENGYTLIVEINDTPGGAAWYEIEVLGWAPPADGATTFAVGFPGQSAVGDYEIAVGPNVLDLAGNAMDQDADGTNGEAEQDVYADAFAVTLPLAPGLWITRVQARGWPMLPDKLEVVFSAPVDDATFDASDVQLLDSLGTPLGAAVVTKLAEQRYELDFGGLLGAGVYTLIVGPDVSAAAGGAAMDQDRNGTGGEATDAYEARLITTALSVPAGDATYDGANLVVTGTTLTIDGAHDLAGLYLLGGATVTHSPTTADAEHSMALTVTDGVWIDGTSSIDVSGRGYVGGRTIGNIAGSTGAQGGSYGGLGHGHGGSVTDVYGDYRDPNELGSGGGVGATSDAGHGGGLVRISSAWTVLDGTIRANGGSGWSPSGLDNAGGSGGGVRLDAGVLTGTGWIQANGGGVSGDGGGGGGGRVAIYYAEADAFDLDHVQALGGDGHSDRDASVGTVYLKDTAGEGVLVLDNHDSPVGRHTPLGVAADTEFVADRLVVRGAGVWVAPHHGMAVTANNVEVREGATLFHLSTTSSQEYALVMTVAHTLTVDSTSAIDVSGRGYVGGRTIGNVAGSTGAQGGSYGGLGHGHSGSVTDVYGDYLDPNEPGSGGGVGSSSDAGHGGGLARITASVAVIDGAIRANGNNGYAVTGMDTAAGSGGGIRLDVGVLSGAGWITANGGDVPSGDGGAGGGGRIAIYYEDMAGFDVEHVRAVGGNGYGSYDASVGTVYLKDTAGEGVLVLDNHDSPVGRYTPLGVAADTEFVADRLVVRGAGVWVAPHHGIAVTANNVEVREGAVLFHWTTTTTQEYSLVMTVAEELIVDADSAIDASDRGYRAGHTVGNTTTGGAMDWAGGSYGGYGHGSTNDVYGDYRDPNELGAGASARSGSGLGVGGGLVRIAAETITLDGAIRANGREAWYETGGWYNGGGAGGGIRLDVGTLGGSGWLTADGGGTSSYHGGGGGGGRIAVYYDTLSGFDTAHITAHGGADTGGQGYHGAVGTVYLKQRGGEGVLRLDSHGATTGSHTPLGLAGETSFTADRLVISGAGVQARPHHEVPISANNVEVLNGAVLSTRATTTSETYSLLMTVAGTLTVDAASAIDVSQRGYRENYTHPNTTTGASADWSGGSYGGLGGGPSPNAVYGDSLDPNELGSGGNARSGSGIGRGGGLLRITASALELAGAIRADGGSAWYESGGWYNGAGSGGGVRLDVGTFSGTGTVSAAGGDTSSYWGGAGGGGRIAVYWWEEMTFPAENVSATGGTDTGGSGRHGAAGTVEVHETDRDTTPPIVTGYTPSGTVNADVAVVQVQFSEAVLDTSFTADDVWISTPGGATDSGDITIVEIDPTKFEVQFPAQSADGRYEFTVGPGITDLVGNPMTLAYEGAFTIDKTGPRVVAMNPSGDVYQAMAWIELTFDSAVEPSSFTAADVSLTGPAGAVTVTQVERIASARYRVRFAQQTVTGAYTLTAGPEITDLVGNEMDQNDNGVNGEATVDAFTGALTMYHPDLAVADAFPPASATVGQTLSVSWIVENVGNHPATADFFDAVYLSADDTLDGGDVALGSVWIQDQTPLPAGESYAEEVSVSVTIPMVAPGPWYLLFQADRDNDQVEVNEANNVLPRAILLEGSDLVVSELAWDLAEIADGQVVTFSAKVENTGSVDAIGNFRVRWELDGQEIGLPWVYGGVAAGQHVWVHQTWTAVPGAHAVRAVADYTGAISEADETNNERSVDLPVVPGPNLIVTDVSWVPQSGAVDGQTVTLAASVQNVGTGDTARDFAVRFEVDGAYVGRRTVHGLAVGDPVAVELSWTAGPGSHTITALVDEYNAVTELSEADNERSEGTLDVPAPDIEVLSVTPAPTPLIDGGAVTLSVVVRNNGAPTVRDVVVRFEVDGAYVGRRSVLSGLDTGQTGQVSLTWPAVPGIHSVRVLADEYDAIAEPNEADNELIQPLPEVFAADLQVTDVQASPAEPFDGQAVTLTATVANAAPAAETLRDFVVRFEVDGQYVGQQTVWGGLEPGETAQVSVGWTAGAGSHTVTAVVDAYGAVTEADENNNTRDAAVNVPAPDLRAVSVTWTPETGLRESEPVTFSATVRNEGDPTTRAFVVRFDVDGAEIGRQTVAGGLAAGGQVVLTQAWTATPGEHTVTVVVDATAAVTESDEDNNEAAGALPVVLAPDLTVAGLAWDPVAITDQNEAIFTATIENLGPGDTAGAFHVRFELDGQFLARQPVTGGLASGGTIDVTVPWSPVPGDHTVTAVVDEYDAVREGDEDNNDRTESLPTILDETAPEIVSFTPLEHSKVKGSTTLHATAWDVVGVTGYTFEQSLDEQAWTPLGGNAEGQVPWDTTALGETVVYVRVTAMDAAGNSSQLVRSYQVDNTAPPAGTLAAEGVEFGVALSWTETAAADFAYYRLHRAAVSGGPYEAINGAMTQTSFVDRTVAVGETYFYVLVVYDHVGNASAHSNEVEAGPLDDATAPVIGSMTPADSTRTATGLELHVSATDNVGVTNYVFEYSDDGATWLPIASGLAATVAWDVAGVPSGQYAVHATVYDALGNAAEASRTYEVDHDPPATPEDLAVSPGQMRLVVSWSPETAADFHHYELSRSVAGGAFEVLAAATTSTVYVDTDVTAGEDHTYRVAAVDTLGNASAASDEASGQPETDTTPPVVQSLAPPAGSYVAGEAALTASATDNVRIAAFVFAYAPEGTQDWVEIGRDDAPAQTAAQQWSGSATWDPAAVPEGQYTLRVAAEDDGGSVAYLAHTVIVDRAPPPAPGLPTVVNPRSGGTLEITWDAVVDPALGGYAVYRAATPGGPYVLAATTTGAAFTDRGLTDGVEVHYVVRSLDRAGNESNRSPEASGVPTAECDLSVEAIGFVPPVPVLNAPSTIDATIHNDGPAPVEADVLFYEGDEATGTLLGTGHVNVPVSGTATAQIAWTPAAAGATTITAVLANVAGTDLDDTNDTRSESLAVNIAPVAVTGGDRADDWAVAIDFDAGASSDADGVIAAYHWDFGDGETADFRQAAHAYMTPGTFPVTLTVTDDRGATATDTCEVTVHDTRADLVIADVSWDPAEPEELDEVTITATIANEGNGPTRYGFFATYYIDGLYRGYQRVNELLEVGESTQVQFLWTAPKGLHTIRIVADDIQNNILETDESNNAAEAGLTLQQIYFPDLVVTDLACDVPPGEVNSEVPLQATATVRNTGTADAFDFWVSLYVDGELASQKHVPELVVDAERTVTFSFDPTEGEHTLEVIADDPVSHVLEGDEANNGRVLDLPEIVLAYPNLTLSAVTVLPAQTVLSDGTSFDLSATVVNAGTVAVEHKFSLSYYLDGEYVGSREVTYLPAGTSQTLAVQARATEGEHTVLVVADEANVIREGVEEDNEAGAEIPEITILYPDLEVTDVFWTPLNPQYGKSVTFRCIVTNNTVVSTLTTSWLSFYVDDVLVESVELPKIRGNSSQPVDVSWSAFADPTVDHTIRAVVDSRDDVPEEDEDNNQYDLPAGTSFSIEDHFVLEVEAPGGMEDMFERLFYGSSSAAEFYATVEMGSVSGPLTPADGVEVTVTITRNGYWGEDEFGESKWFPSEEVHSELMAFDAGTARYGASVSLLEYETQEYTVRFVATDGPETAVLEKQMTIVQEVRFSLTTDKETYRRGEVVHVSGQVLTLEDEPVDPGTEVTLILTKGWGDLSSQVVLWGLLDNTARTYETVVGANGTFSYELRPAWGDAGDFSIDGYVTSDIFGTAGHTEFAILAMDMDPARLHVTTSKNRTYTTTLTLSNPSGLPLTGVTVALEDEVPDDNVTAVIGGGLSGGTLASGARVPITLTVTIPEDAPDSTSFNVYVSSDEGVSALSRVRFTLKPARPAPDLEPGQVKVGVNPGTLLSREITLTNDGMGTMSGITLIEPPILPWVSLAGLGTDTLAPGESTTFEILIAPGEDVARGVYADKIVATDGEYRAEMVLTVEVSSANRGSVSFVVTNDNNEQVGGTELTLVSKEEFQVVYGNGYTSTYHNVFTAFGSDQGIVTVEDIPIGEYEYALRAPGHETIRGDVTVMPQSEAQIVAVEMVAVLIQYKWTVKPIIIEDTYDITLNLTFAAEIPTPQFAFLPPWVTIPHDVQDGWGDQVVVLNPSLIALHDVTVEVVGAEGITLSSSGRLGDLAAQTSTVFGYTVAPGDYSYLDGQTTYLRVRGTYVEFDPETYLPLPEETLLEGRIPLVNPSRYTARVTMGGDDGAEIEIEMPEDGDGDGEDFDKFGLEDFNLPKATVTAVVKIEIKQKATLEREGFDARLELINGMDKPMVGLSISPRVMDASGLDVTDRFYIVPPELTGIGAVDG